ncbi:hypothetical protein ET495_16905 [Xylanimonas allomyrinae]|uniref:Alternate-type signal peptide domain-containing protein n=1 Tax=Xylanimonas allomyrinae TaxID=2509459 RepID=A0A4V0YEL2_9MICO|nr:SipW-dependent-type signal peptide-containing protein [Xylanimonas allomyrinae]QAY64601.1 hypothetical protein ET495_16905 [Xylanimonas allomyrinae]
MATRTRPRAGRSRTLLVVTSPFAAAAVASVLAAGGTLAAWSSEGSLPDVVVSAGDLDLRVVGALWQQVPPGSGATAGQPLADTNPGVVSMPGDVYAIRLDVETYLQGDNLEGALRVEYAGAVADDVAAGRAAVSFHVEDADGNPVAPTSGDADAGATVAVPGLRGGSEGVTTSWRVVVTVRVLGDNRWVTPDTEGYPGEWSSGDFVVHLDQVRRGGAAG